MTEELSYVLITPHSIKKSRTGAIISRLISRSGLELAAGRMFAPCRELIEKYARNIVTDDDPRHRRTQELIREYVLKNFVPAGKEDYRPRVLMLVFRGENAVRRVLEVAGHIVHERTSGETIRDTFGDYIVEDGTVRYFEPAVLAPPTREVAEADLRLWAEYSDSDGGLLEDAVGFPAEADVQTTLVLIKPDNFRFPNARPGGVIDTFSKTGLYIVGFKVHHMSVAQAEIFYGPVLDVLKRIMRDSTGARAKDAVARELGIPLDPEMANRLADVVAPVHARSYWESIIEFMAGRRPADCPSEARERPGTEKCVALIYRGDRAVSKIREVLGPTDPSQAPPGSIRREFGQSIMINAAHASDSPENARREMEIIGMDENNLKALIESHFSTH